MKIENLKSTNNKLLVEKIVVKNDSYVSNQQKTEKEDYIAVVMVGTKEYPVGTTVVFSPYYAERNNLLGKTYYTIDGSQIKFVAEGELND